MCESDPEPRFSRPNDKPTDHEPIWHCRKKKKTMCLKLSDISYCGFLGCVPTPSQECSASHLNNCPVPQLRTSMLLVCSLVSGSRVIPRSVARPLNPAAPKLHVTCWPGRKKQERCSKHKHRGLGRANQGSLKAWKVSYCFLMADHWGPLSPSRVRTSILATSRSYRSQDRLENHSG